MSKKINFVEKSTSFVLIEKLSESKNIETFKLNQFYVKTKMIAESSFEQKKMSNPTLETNSYNETHFRIEQCPNVLILKLFEKID